MCGCCSIVSNIGKGEARCKTISAWKEEDKSEILIFTSSELTKGCYREGEKKVTLQNPEI